MGIIRAQGAGHRGTGFRPYAAQFATTVSDRMDFAKIKGHRLISK